jgi:hypothetical protein
LCATMSLSSVHESGQRSPVTSLAALESNAVRGNCRTATVRGDTVTNPISLCPFSAIRPGPAQLAARASAHHGHGHAEQSRGSPPARSLFLALRSRWHNHLNPHIRKEAWTPEEDRMILAAHIKYGNQWSYIAKLLPGR